MDIKLLPEYEAWLHASPDRPEFMLVYNTRLTSFAAVLDILNPEVVMRDGLYVRVSQLSDPNDYKGYLTSGLTKSEIESRVNRLRIKDLFQHDPDTDKVSSQLLSLFAQEIKRYWTFNLSAKYPNTTFNILVIDPEVDPEVTFFVQR